MSAQEQIWYDDLAHFFTADNFYVVLPFASMTLDQKLNAIVRFFIYMGVILAIATRNAAYLFFGIVAMMLSIAFRSFDASQQAGVREAMDKRGVEIVNQTACVRSTVDNPFMNPTLLDLKEFPDRPMACDVTDERIKDVMQKNFEARFAKDAGDVYNRDGGFRQFYTMPNTQIPNDQTGFAEWLYGTGPTCKEGNGQACDALNYRHVRA